MPTYTYECQKCGFAYELNIAMKDRNKPEMEKCPSCHEGKVVKTICPVKIGDPVLLGIRKPDSGFRARIAEIVKAKDTKGYRTNPGSYNNLNEI